MATYFSQRPFDLSSNGTARTGSYLKWLIGYCEEEEEEEEGEEEKRKRKRRRRRIKGGGGEEEKDEK